MTQAKKIEDARAARTPAPLPEIGPLAGFSEPADPDFDALAQLASGGPVAIFLGEPFQPRAGWKAVGGAPLVQMVW